MRLARGRQSRVVLTPRRRRQASQKCLRGDGDKKARSPGRARNKPLKPSRAGMPGDPGATVVTNSCALLHFAHEAAGATGTRHSPLPLGVAPRPLWADRSCTTRAHCAAGTRRYILSSLRGAKRRSNPLLLFCLMDCFASLATTVLRRGRLKIESIPPVARMSEAKAGASVAFVPGCRVRSSRLPGSWRPKPADGFGSPA
jgi:hypothetical protein